MQSTPYEFMQQWNGVPRDKRGISSSRHYASILRQLPPAKLPDLITNKLEGHMLSSILAAVAQELLPNSKRMGGLTGKAQDALADICLYLLRMWSVVYETILHSVYL